MSKVKFHWPVDAHVHFHSLDAVGPTLDAAATNFRLAGAQSEALLGALLLAQAGGEQVFEALLGRTEAGGWSLTRARDEPESLLARRNDEVLAIVCGRQVRARDGLEVLGLGTLARVPDGMPLADAVTAVRDTGALVVLPWGFGKWWGARGNRVEQLFATLGPNAVFVGDNSSRLGLLGRPALMQDCVRRGFRVLPGTDPLPFPSGRSVVGGFGFYAEIEPEPAAPWRTLRAWLTAAAQSPASYGHAADPFRFVYDQVRIQLRNLLGKGRHR